MDLFDQIIELGRYGYSCGQILALLMEKVTGEENPALVKALGEFTRWFQDEITADYGGINCEDIIGTDPAKRVEYCPQIMAASFEKCMEILEEKGLL